MLSYCSHYHQATIKVSCNFLVNFGNTEVRVNPILTMKGCFFSFYLPFYFDVLLSIKCDQLIFVHFLISGKKFKLMTAINFLILSYHPDICMLSSPGHASIKVFRCVPDDDVMMSTAVFLIPYLTFLLLIGMPLFFMEVSYGQFASLSPITVWRMSPLFKGEICCVFLVAI